MNTANYPQWGEENEIFTPHQDEQQYQEKRLTKNAPFIPKVVNYKTPEWMKNFVNKILFYEK